MVTQIWLQNNYIVLPFKVRAVFLVLLVAGVGTDSEKNVRLRGSSLTIEAKDKIECLQMNDKNHT